MTTEKRTHEDDLEPVRSEEEVELRDDDVPENGVLDADHRTKRKTTRK